MTTTSAQRLLLRVAGPYFKSVGDAPAEIAYNSLITRAAPVRNDGSESSRDNALQQRMVEKDLRDLERGRRLDKVVHTVAAAVRSFAKKVDTSNFGGEVSMVRGEDGAVTPEVTSRAEPHGRAKQAAGLQSVMGKFAALMTALGTVIEKMGSQGGFTKVLRTALAQPADSWTDQDYSAKSRALGDLTEIIKASSADLEGILGIEDDVLVHGLTKKASLLDLATSLRIVDTLLTQLNLAVGRWVDVGDESSAKNCHAVADQTASYLEAFGDDLGLLAAKMSAEVKNLRARF